MIRVYLLLFIILVFSAVAHADGFHVSDYQQHLYEPSQKAIIGWDGKVETMILSSAVKSDDIANFAWIIPIRSSVKPEVTAGDISIFEDLVRYFEKEYKKYVDDDRMRSLGIEGVSVVETKKIDVYDITILKATKLNDLLDWLNQNEYQVPNEARPILDKYITEGNCYFIVNKINLKNKFKNEINLVNKIGAKKAAQKTYLDGLSFNEIISYIPDYLPSIEELADCFYDPFYYSKELREGEYKQIKFLNQEFMDKLKYQNRAFINNASMDDPEQISSHWWHLIAASFESELPARFVIYLSDKSPGLYCGNNNLIYSNPAIIKSAVNLGNCSFFKREKKRLIKEKILDFYISYGKSKKQIKEAFNKLLVPEGTDFKKLSELKKCILDLRKGVGTPLKIEFTPPDPYYPLLVSSLNKGETIIEIYVIGANPVYDKNKILSGSSKKINVELSDKLKKHIAHSKMQYVTRLRYNGNLKGLINDASFEVNMAAESLKNSSDNK